jgi:hypothetical protein
MLPLFCITALEPDVDGHSQELQKVVDQVAAIDGVVSQTHRIWSLFWLVEEAAGVLNKEKDSFKAKTGTYNNKGLRYGIQDSIGKEK